MEILKEGYGPYKEEVFLSQARSKKDVMLRSIGRTIRIGSTPSGARVVLDDQDTGKVTDWYVGPNGASPHVDHEIDAQFFAAFAKTYPNITVEKQSFTYNDLLDKIRTAALRKAVPTVARLTLLWAPELAAKGFLTSSGPRMSAIRPANSGRAR